MSGNSCCRTDTCVQRRHLCGRHHAHSATQSVPPTKPPAATHDYLCGVPPLIVRRFEEGLDIRLRRSRRCVRCVDEHQLGDVLQSLVQPAALELRDHGLTVSRRTVRSFNFPHKTYALELRCWAVAHTAQHLVLKDGRASAEAVQTEQAQARQRRPLRRLRHDGWQRPLAITARAARPAQLFGDPKGQGAWSRLMLVDNRSIRTRCYSAEVCLHMLH